MIALLSVSLTFVSCANPSPPASEQPSSPAEAAIVFDLQARDLLTGEPIDRVHTQIERLGYCYKIKAAAPGYIDHLVWQQQQTAALVLALAPAARERYQQAAWKNERGPRLVLLELDGMDFDLIKRFQQAGGLPAISVLSAGGSGGILRSCCDTFSPVVWTSINTGLPPEEHGVKNLHRLDPQTGETLLVTSADIRAPRLWHIACHHGLSAQVGGVFFPDPGDDFFTSSVGRTNRIELTRAAAKNNAPQLLVVYEPAADLAGHLSWQYFEPELFRQEGWAITDTETAFFGERIPQAYRDLDAWVGLALALAGPQTTILAVSDHGFAPKPHNPSYKFSTDNFLAAIKSLTPDLYNCNLPLPDEIGFCAPPGTATGPLARLFAEAKAPSGEPLFSGIRHRDEPPFDNQNSPFFALRLKINMRLIEQLASRARANLEEESEIRIGSLTFPLSRFLVPANNSGDHRMEGVFLIAGSNIRSGIRLETATVFDVAPTALAVLGLPAAADMPGRIWTEVFRRPPATKRIASYGRIQPAARAEKPSLEMLDQLRSLGYLH